MLEKEHGIRLLDYFDMFTGTSTGSLIAAAILNGESAQSIYDTYADDNSPIFSTKNNIKNTMREAFFPQYSAEAFEQSLVERFNEMKLGDLAKKSGKSFAFFATNFTKAKIAIYPSPNFTSVADEYQNQTVLEALRASSAAPFYFSPVSHPDSNHLLIDGGL
jgi:patatin-like phospholipase/acyl hydrolase